MSRRLTSIRLKYIYEQTDRQIEQLIVNAYFTKLTDRRREKRHNNVVFNIILRNDDTLQEIFFRLERRSISFQYNGETRNLIYLNNYEEKWTHLRSRILQMPIDSNRRVISF